jgi:Tol biopolymer transport system component/predicted Ser/Thr protein kinase
LIDTTISHYRITEKLGEGGMGVVYKAEDTKLKRPVALKFLAPHLLRDEEGRKRFLREAQDAASLDHPNICTVHEIDEADDRTFIVMAFLEGRPLRERIKEGPLKLSEALSIAIQMAEGLDAAHEKGITHRDIKPDNVMLMAGSRGLVKLMDFGLAQLAGSSKFTREGTTLGTVSYMSPEQAEGAETSHRTDIWSLGVVLYEMVAGHLPFRGDFDQAVIYSIMNEPAEPLTAVRSGVPKELDRIVDKCLAKEPEQRYQHADDLLVDLRTLRAEMEPQAARVSAGSGAAKRVSPAIIGAAAAVVLGAVGLGWWFGRQGEPAAQGPPEYNLRQITRDAGVTHQPALSPDGRLLAYSSDRGGAGNRDIWVQQLGSGEPIRLTDHDSDDVEPSFSPDGSQIVFRSARDGGGLYVIPALGGNVRRLAADGFDARFSPDGKWISYVQSSTDSSNRFFISLHVASIAGGAAREVSTGLALARAPVWSPDSRYLLFEGGTEPEGFGVFPDSDWWIVPLEGGEAVQLGAAQHLETAGIAAGRGIRAPVPRAWLSAGNRILFSAAVGDGAANLWQFEISADPWRLLGPPQRLTSGTGEAQPSASNDGRIVFTSAAADWDIWSLPLDPNKGQATGPLEKFVSGLSFEAYPTVSADGAKLLYISDRAGNQDVWLRDVKSGADTPVTVSPQPEIRAALSPDGSRVAFARLEDRRINLYVSDDSGGSERKMVEGIGNIMDWIAGENKILFYTPTPILWMTLDPETGKTEEIALHHPEYPVHDVRFSPDRHWVAFKLFMEARRYGPMFIARADGYRIAEQSEWIPIADPLWNMRNWWSPDGATLYFLSWRDQFACIWRQRLNPKTKKPLGDPVAVQHFHGESRSLNPNFLGYGMAADRLYFPLGTAKGNIWLAEPQSAP